LDWIGAAWVLAGTSLRRSAIIATPPPIRTKASVALKLPGAMQLTHDDCRCFEHQMSQPGENKAVPIQQTTFSIHFGRGVLAAMTEDGGFSFVPFPNCQSAIFRREYLTRDGQPKIKMSIIFARLIAATKSLNS
jgi:hypothetical protein